MYVIHEDRKLAMPVTVWQYDGHVEERMAVEGLPLAARQYAESPCHRYRVLSWMIFRIEQLRWSPAADGNRAGVIPRRVRSLHLVVDVLSSDEGVMRREPRWMQTVAQHEYRCHGVG